MAAVLVGEIFFRELSAYGDAFFYRNFTFPLYHANLKALGPGSPTVAIGASEGDTPLGLGLATDNTILSIFVKEERRNEGIGTRLLEQLECALAERGCEKAHVSFLSGQPGAPAFARLLEKRMWSAPVAHMLICRSGTNMRHAPWLRFDTVPPPYTITPWAEVTDEEIREIDRTHAEDPWIPAELVPSIQEKDFEPINSLALRRDGTIVGWLICHRIEPDTIRYTTSFVRKDIQSMGRVVPLYAQAVRLQISAGVFKGVWAVPYHHPRMINFAKKHFGPYLEMTEESLIAERILA